MADDRDWVQRLGKVFFDSYFVVNRERKIEDFNEGFVQLLGLRPAQRRTIKGTACYSLLRLGICRENCIALECLTRGGHVRKEEIRGTAGGDRELVLELSAIPLRNNEGQVSGVFVTHRDVTDERRLKTRYLEEHASHRAEREALLKIIRDRDEELEEARRQTRARR